MFRKKASEYDKNRKNVIPLTLLQSNHFYATITITKFIVKQYLMNNFIHLEWNLFSDNSNKM